MNPTRHLLIHEAALGDFVLLFPLLRKLAGNTIVASTIAKAQLASRLIPGILPLDIDRLYRVTSHEPTRELLTSVDIVISFVSDAHDNARHRPIPMAPQARHVFIVAKPPDDCSLHLTQWYLSECTRAGIQYPIDPVAPLPHNPVSPRRIVLHPGAGAPAKRWPLSRFAQLAQMLLEHQRNVRWIVTPDDLEMAGHERPLLNQLVRRFDGQILESLDRLQIELEQAWIFVGNDSGPGHLAAQVGVGVVSLFGPTDPRVWAPIGPRVHVLSPPTPQPMQWLAVNDVFEQIQRVEQLDYFASNAPT